MLGGTGRFPPGAYKGPEPFVPFALGLVELPEGLRVMSPLEGDIDALKIGNDALRTLTREVEQRPLVTLAVAFGVGMIAAGLVVRRG